MESLQIAGLAFLFVLLIFIALFLASEFESGASFLIVMAIGAAIVTLMGVGAFHLIAPFL